MFAKLHRYPVPARSRLRGRRRSHPRHRYRRQRRGARHSPRGAARPAPVSRGRPPGAPLAPDRGGAGRTRPALATGLLEYRDRSTALVDVAAVNSFSAALISDGDPEQVQLGVVTANLFSVLGVRPAIGRDFTADDDTPMDTRDPRNASVIILSHELWRRLFGSDPRILGRSVLIGGTPMEVIGVLPDGFRLHLPPDAGMATDLAAWTPLRIPYATAPRDGAYLKALGRLRPGVGAGAAEAELSVVASDLRARFPHHEQAGLRVAVRPMADEVAGHLRPTLMAVAAAAAFVLLIACANVANLYLARLARRRREMTIRAALGGSPGQLAGQLLVETGVLAFLAGVAGLGLGWAAIRLVGWLQPGTLPRIEAVRLDGPLLGLGAGLALLTLLAFGLAPALLAARPRLAESLAVRGASERRGWRRLSAGLVVLQAGSALVLLAATGLMLRSAATVANADLGYEPEQVLTLRVALPFTTYRTPDRWVGTFLDLEHRIGAIEGIEAVGATSALPSTGGGSVEPYAVEAVSGSPARTGQALYRTVTPGYFAAMRIPVRSGRTLAESDRPNPSMAIVIDEALARRVWGDGSPIGRRIRVTVERFERGYTVEQVGGEVVGVVTTVAHARADLDAPGTIYRSHAQVPLWNMALTVRSSMPAADLLRAVRAAVSAIDPRLPIHRVREMPAVVAETATQVRAVFVAAGVFAAIAVTLAVVGLYGVVVIAVRRRRREFGIRLALGAGPRALLGRVVREGLALGGAGVVLGLAAAVGLTRFLGSLLVGVEPLDPATLLGAALTLSILATVASFLAAREAASVDPIETLSGD